MRVIILLTMLLGLIASQAFASRTVQDGGYTLRGKLDSYYKVQDNYKSALDYGSGKIRGGANNREDQNVRTRLEIEFIPYSGPLNIPGRKETRRWIGYSRIKFDANDPDINKENDDLGQSLDIENAWFRYSPAAFIGIKVGRMSVVPTINARLTYEFSGDKDDDFTLYSANGLLNKDGFEIDVWPAEGVQLGVSELQGMSRGGRISTNGASSTRAKTRVVWAKIQKPHFAFQLARQYVRSSQTYADESRRYIFHHRTQNWAFQLRTFPEFQPWIGNQRFWGEKTYRPFVSGDIANIITSTGISPSASCLLNESKNGEYVLRTFGFVSKLGNGGLAFERTKYDAPDFCSPNHIVVNSELDYHQHSEAWYKPYKNIKVFAFYHESVSRFNRKLRDDVAAYRKDAATLGALPAEFQAALAPAIAGINGYADALEAQTYSNTTSRGIGVTISF